MTTDHFSLGDAIQNRREAVGLTQDELSDKAGLAYSTLAKIERGAVKNPSVFTIAAIAQALGCEIDELLDVEVATGDAQAPGETFLFCDMNGVLVRFFQKAFVQIAEENQLTVDKVETAFWHYNDAANRGEISLEAFNNAMAEHLKIPSFDWHRCYLDNVEPIVEMQEWLVEVVKQHRVGILSNTHAGLIEKMIERGLIPNLPYACIVDSSQVHAIKPEHRVYEIAEQMAGAHGSDIVFVDDSRANLIAAQRHGWRVMWFDDYRPADSVERLKQALES